jgi:hypothetical protein
MNENYPQNISSKHIGTVMKYLSFEKDLTPQLADEIHTGNDVEARFFFLMKNFHMWAAPGCEKLEDDWSRNFANSSGPALSVLTQVLAYNLISIAEDEKDLKINLGLLARIVQLARIAGAVAYSDLIRLEELDKQLVPKAL